jgi:hypothetical protein
VRDEFGPPRSRRQLGVPSRTIVVRSCHWLRAAAIAR